LRYTPLILNIGTKWELVVNYTPQPRYLWERAPVPAEYEAGWTPQPVSVFLEMRKPLRELRFHSHRTLSTVSSGPVTRYTRSYTGTDGDTVYL
jgi:hypothetical protein